MKLPLWNRENHLHEADSQVDLNNSNRILTNQFADKYRPLVLIH